jgi:hypothetical protein
MIKWIKKMTSTRRVKAPRWVLVWAWPSWRRALQYTLLIVKINPL